MLDLTVYLAKPSETEFDYLVDLYEKLCPPRRLLKYTIAELQDWPEITRPRLTSRGQAAAATRARRPYFEPERERIRHGRAFEAQYWDGRSLADPDGSWSFGCRCIHRRATGLHAFARILIPLQADPSILRSAALAIAENVELISGHGGLVFAYDPWKKAGALDVIYARTRRFWGADIEDLNDTLPLMKAAIKGVSWLTLVGRDFARRPDVAAEIEGLSAVSSVTIEERTNATLVAAGPEPVPGDQNRPDRSLDPYYAVANALKPLFLDAHPDFPSGRFVDNGNTVGWIRRFIEPAGWR